MDISSKKRAEYFRIIMLWIEYTAAVRLGTEAAFFLKYNTAFLKENAKERDDILEPSTQDGTIPVPYREDEQPLSEGDS
jgi:hypothetical protein